MIARVALVLSLVLALVPAPARASQLGARRDGDPADDALATYRLSCHACGDGWAVLENVGLVADMFAFALEPSISDDTLLPAMTLASATFVGFDAGVVLLGGESRPFGDWVIIFAARTLAMLLTWVAANQLPLSTSIPLAIVLTAGASLPQFLLSPHGY